MQTNPNHVSGVAAGANHAKDASFDAMHGAAHSLATQLEHGSEQAQDMVHRGVDAVRHSSAQMMDRLTHANESTLAFIKREPLKAVFISAAVGAGLVFLMGLVSRRRSRD